MTNVEMVMAALKALKRPARNKEVVEWIGKKYPEANGSSIQSTISWLKANNDEISDPGRGWVSLVSIDEAEAVAASKEATPRQYEEAKIYEPLRQFLLQEEICNNAIISGSFRFNGKWGNPDVFGVFKPLASQFYKFQPEYVAAEIKDANANLVEAFGQAVAYQLFTHRSYLVVPESETTKTRKDDLDRIDTLCEMVGIGLILFKIDGETYSFRQEVRAKKSAPDAYFLNSFLNELKARVDVGFDDLI